jgi:hypothetical protein
MAVRDNVESCPDTTPTSTTVSEEKDPPDIWEEIGAPIVPVSQGHLTVSAAIAVQVASVGAGVGPTIPLQRIVLAPLALQARTRGRQERAVRPRVSPVAQAPTRLQERPRVSPVAQALQERPRVSPVAQATTGMRQERPRVSPVAQAPTRLQERSVRPFVSPVAQAPTRMRQERPRVSPVVQGRIQA